MRPPGWRPALHIARRDALRARGRSALIVAMIALPVFVLTAVDVLLRTYELDPADAVVRKLGAADAQYATSYEAGPILQDPSGDFASPADPEAEAGLVDPRTVLPEGAKAILDRTGRARVHVDDGVLVVEFRELDYADPMAEGILRQVDGRAPRSRDEVAVTPELLEVGGLAIGDEIRAEAADTVRSFTVVGTALDPNDLSRQAVVAPPGVLLADRPAEPGSIGDFLHTAWLVDTREPVTWDDVLAANEKGIQVSSRSVILDPPPRSAVPYYQEDRLTGTAAPVAVAIVAIGLAALEVTLLAGAAFAVGARRQSRDLALVVAAGGNARQVRRIVLAGGVVLGAVGAVVGVVLGVAGGAAAAPLLAGFVPALPGGFDVRPLEVAAVALLGVVTGALAAIVPARGASRQDVLAVLTGRRGTVRTPRRQPATGFLVLAAGVGVTVLGAVRRTPYVIVAGAAITQLGLIVMAPAIVGWVGRLGRYLPLTPRLAARDASRHRGRSAPAAAAVMAAVAGATALSVYFESDSDYLERTYQPQARPGQAVVDISLERIDAAQRVAMERAVADNLPVTETMLVREVATEANCAAGSCQEQRFELAMPPQGRCPVDEGSPDLSREELRRLEDDPRCWRQYTYVYDHVVGDADTLRALAGTSSPEAEATLGRGGVVVFDPYLVHGGRATARVRRADGEGEPKVEKAALPATYLPVERARPHSVLSPAAAKRLGVDVQPTTIMVGTSRMPTKQEEERAAAALARTGTEAFFHVERGYVHQYGLVLLILMLGSAVITLGASGIATGLANADSRADHSTLAAVGASPRVRRFLAAAQAGTISWLGTALGILAGFVPGLAIVWALTEVRIAIPWTTLGTILVAVPLLALVAALVFTRSRLPLVRGME